MREWEVHNHIRKETDEWKRTVLSRVREVFHGQLDYTEGNHTQRLREWVGEENVSEWMGLDEYNVTYHTRAGVYLKPEFLVKHGDYATKETAKKEYMENRCSGWSGHVHRYQQYGETFPDTGKRYTWTSAPTMSRLDYDYGPGSAGLARWDQGFLVGTLGSGVYDNHTDLARYWDGKLTIRGEVY